MIYESLVNRDWAHVVARLGDLACLDASARKTRAFVRARAIENAVDLLRMILAHCLSARGLRSTTAWASAIGLANVSNVALLYRLRRCGDWLALLVGQTLAFDALKAVRGRLIRLLDATTVPKVGALSKTKNKLWCVLSAFRPSISRTLKMIEGPPKDMSTDVARIGQIRLSTWRGDQASDFREWSLLGQTNSTLLGAINDCRAAFPPSGRGAGSRPPA
jgi:hypothetical protein